MIIFPNKGCNYSKGNIMIGKLTDNGLEIKRHGKWIKQYCPYVPGEKIGGEFIHSQCGPNCPIFGNPIKTVELRSEVTKIQACKTKPLIFEEFFDERA